jgi:hypothetical protein
MTVEAIERLEHSEPSQRKQSQITCTPAIRYSIEMRRVHAWCITRTCFRSKKMQLRSSATQKNVSTTTTAWRQGSARSNSCSDAVLMHMRNHEWRRSPKHQKWYRSENSTAKPRRCVTLQAKKHKKLQITLPGNIKLVQMSENQNLQHNCSLHSKMSRHVKRRLLRSH